MKPKQKTRVPLQDECETAALTLQAWGVIGGGFSPMTLASVLLKYQRHKAYAYGSNLREHLMAAATLKGVKPARGGTPSEVLERFLHQSTQVDFGLDDEQEHEALEEMAATYQLRTGKIFDYDPQLSVRENTRKLREADIAELRASR